MFFFVIILLQFYNVHLLSWRITNWLSGERNDKPNYQGFDETVTGRLFVTMMGYPSRCEKKGITHACTLSVACWWVGGSSQAGCGANPWLVACCVKYNVEQAKKEMYDLIQDDIQSNHITMIQRRNEDADECGLSSDRTLSKRIIGGDEAKFAQFPWQAHLKISTYQCGGALVSHRFVATAAHCIARAQLKDIIVYLGELDTQNTGKVFEEAPSERHEVKKKILHPFFKFRSTQPDRYDLALLQLKKGAGYKFHIMPICLPEPDIDLRGKTAIVAGWGKTRPSTDPTGTNILQSAVVPILDIKECMSWHRIKEITVELYEDMLCAGHKDGRKDACLGDSGGPLIVLIYGRWTLAGIISAGFGCGEPHQPGIYHSVAVTVNWIVSVINS